MSMLRARHDCVRIVPIAAVQKHPAPKLEINQCQEMIGIVVSLCVVLGQYFFDEGPVEETSSICLFLGQEILRERTEFISEPCPHRSTKPALLTVQDLSRQPVLDNFLQYILHSKAAYLERFRYSSR